MELRVQELRRASSVVGGGPMQSREHLIRTRLLENSRELLALARRVLTERLRFLELLAAANAVVAGDRNG